MNNNARHDSSRLNNKKYYIKDMDGEGKGAGGLLRGRHLKVVGSSLGEKNRFSLNKEGNIEDKTT